MPDFTPVGNTGAPIQSPNTLQSLSGILGLAQQRQSLGIQAQELQQQKVRTQEATGLNQFFSEWAPGDHVAADGTTDIDSAHGSTAYQNLPGVARAAVDQKLIQIKQGQIQNASSLLGLTRDQLGIGSQLLGSLTQDSDVITGSENGKAKVQAALSQWGELGGPAGAKVAQTYSKITDGNLKPGDPTDPNNPGDLVQRIRALQKAALTADRQLQITQPGGGQVQTTGGVQAVNVNPYAQGTVGAPLGRPVVNAPPPGLVTSPAGPIVRTTPGGGMVPLTSAAPLGGATSGVGTAPNLNATRAQVETQVGLARGVTERVTQAQTAANNTIQAQDALSRVKSILEGPNAPATGAAFLKQRDIQNLFSSAGIDTQGATDMNSLVKNLARYEAARATAAGLGGTDAARELSHNGQPNVAIDNRALLGIVNQSLATEKAIAAYASKQARTQDPAKLQQNESDFRSIPNLIEGYQYGMSRNAAEANQFLGEHGLKPQDMARTRQAIKQFESQ